MADLKVRWYYVGERLCAQEVVLGYGNLSKGNGGIDRTGEDGDKTGMVQDA